MARPLRIEFPGAIYHVTSRGNERKDIFRSDTDRNLFLTILARTIGRMQWHCHAYCLMGNHYHLVLETPQANLSRGMRQLNGCYTQSINRQRQRVGHLFQGRYKAILIERESYLLTVLRYVVLNPVRARMVARPQEWPWSNHAATGGWAPAPHWLETDWVLSEFGKRRAAAQKRYRAFVDAALEARDSLWDQLRQQVILGSESYAEKMLGNVSNNGDLQEIPLVQRQRPPQPLAWYREQGMEEHRAMAEAHLNGGYRLREIAEVFGVHYSTVSRAVRRCEQGSWPDG